MKYLQLKVPSALNYFAALVAEDQGFALVEAAICVAQDEQPELDAQAVLGEIDRLAARLKARLPSDAPALRLREPLGVLRSLRLRRDYVVRPGPADRARAAGGVRDNLVIPT